MAILRMTRAEYEGLLSKVKRDSKSLTQMREEMQASKILRRTGLLKNLFGNDLSELAEGERAELRLAASGIGTFKKFLKPYLERRVEDYPADYFDSRCPEEISGFSDKRVGVDDLEKALESLRYVLDQHIGWVSGQRLKYLENQGLSEEFSQLRTTGSVFSLAKFLKELPRRVKG